MAAAYNGPPRILRNSALILRDLQRNNASYRWENAMKENLGTCDLRAIAVSRNQSDRMDEESIRESERLHPHYRYEIVCSKWNVQFVLGRGYRYGEARRLAQILTQVCDEARPREDSWTKPHFRMQRIVPAIRQRGIPGDVAFIEHDANFIYNRDGSLSSFTRRDLIGLVEACDDNGTVSRFRALNDEVSEFPKVVRSYSRDDIHIESFIAEITRDLASKDRLETYNYLTSVGHNLWEQMLRHAREEIERTPLDVEKAAHYIRTWHLPTGHERPRVDIDSLWARIDPVAEEQSLRA